MVSFPESVGGETPESDVSNSPQNIPQRRRSLDGAPVIRRETEHSQRTRQWGRDQEEGVNTLKRKVEPAGLASGDLDRVKLHRVADQLKGRRSDMKETRLEILSSLKSKRESLVKISRVSQGLASSANPTTCEASVAPTTASLHDMTDPSMRWP